MIREPLLDDAPLLELVAMARGELGEGGWLCVHDRVHVACAAGADAVHLGFRSLDPEAARVAAGEALTIGLSTHAQDDRGTWRRADYLFHGPVHPTPSKAGLVEPVGMAGLKAAVDEAGPRPVWGIGGLEVSHAAPLLETGARGVAVLRGVLGASDPERQASLWCEALERRSEVCP